MGFHTGKRITTDWHSAALNWQPDFFSKLPTVLPGLPVSSPAMLKQESLDEQFR